MTDLVWAIAAIAGAFVVFAILGRWLGRRSVTGPGWGARHGTIVRPEPPAAARAANVQAEAPPGPEDEGPAGG